MAKSARKPPKLVGVRDVQTNLSALIDESQHRTIVLTRHGRPVALLIGCEGKDPDKVLARAFTQFALAG